MDLTNVGGINVALIAGIIGVLFTIKRLDKRGRLGKKFYVVAVLLMGFGAGILNSEKTIWNFMLVDGIIHAGVASILYQTGKLILPGESGFFKSGKRK